MFSRSQLTSLLTFIFLFSVLRFLTLSFPARSFSFIGSTLYHSTVPFCRESDGCRFTLGTTNLLSRHVSVNVDSVGSPIHYIFSKLVQLSRFCLSRWPLADEHLEQSSSFCTIQNVIRVCLQSKSSRQICAGISSRVSQTESWKVSDRVFVLVLHGILVSKVVYTLCSKQDTKRFSIFDIFITTILSPLPQLYYIYRFIAVMRNFKLTDLFNNVRMPSNVPHILDGLSLLRLFPLRQRPSL